MMIFLCERFFLPQFLLCQDFMVFVEYFTAHFLSLIHVWTFILEDILLADIYLQCDFVCLQCLHICHTCLPFLLHFDVIHYNCLHYELWMNILCLHYERSNWNSYDVCFSQKCFLYSRFKNIYSKTASECFQKKWYKVTGNDRKLWFYEKLFLGPMKQARDQKFRRLLCT